MTTRRHALLPATLLALLVPLCATTVHAADPGDVQSQLSELRRDLADTRLQLQQARGELNDIKQFLAEKNIDQKLAEWRAERDKLAEERRQLQMERARLESARKALHQDTTRIAQQTADDQQKQQQQQQQTTAPLWSAQYEIGLIDKQSPTVYLNRINGQILIDQYPTVERHKVKVRGSFYNRSTAPWRYLFEIRIATAQPIGLGTRKILASEPYQTPLLTPGELHKFEVEVQLKGGDVGEIDIVQIGNVTADRPGDPTNNIPAVGTTPAAQVGN